MTTYHSTKHRQLCKHCGEDRGKHSSALAYCPNKDKAGAFLSTRFEAAPRDPDKELAEAEAYSTRQGEQVTKLNVELGKLERKVKRLTREKATASQQADEACAFLNGKLATAELDTRTAQAALADVRADLDRELAKNETLLAEAKARDASDESAQAKAARQTAEINRLSEQLASEKRARKDAEAARAAHLQADADAIRRHAALRETDAQTIRRLQGQRDRMGTTIAQLEAQRKVLAGVMAKILGHKVTSATGNVELDVVCMALKLANRRPSDEEQYEQE